MKPLLLATLLLVGCATPTLQQRQDTWLRYQAATRATCVVGSRDTAMPTEVRAWCAEVVGP